MTPTTAAENNDVLSAHTDIPRAPITGDAERASWVIVLYQGGASVDEIATALGAEREFVRRTVVGAGLSWRRGVRSVDALAIMREVRRPETLSLRDAALRLGYAEETVRHSVAALGMSEAVRRLLRLRRRAARRAAGIANTPVQSIAARTERIERVA